MRVKQILVEQGSSVAELARELGYARNSVSIAIHHPTMLPGVREQVKKALGV